MRGAFTHPGHSNHALGHASLPVASDLMLNDNIGACDVRIVVKMVHYLGVRRP